MKRLGLSILLFIIMLNFGMAADPRYFTRTGFVSFISHTPLIDIEGTDKLVMSFMNIKTGDMVFSVFIKDFKFKLALAEDHFNENYMFSGKYPQSNFKGKIKNIASIDLTKPGRYEARIEGDLTIKDKTKFISVTGNLEVKDGKIYGNATFSVLLKDYNIEVPKIVDDKVAKEIPITVNMIYETYSR